MRRDNDGNTLIGGYIYNKDSRKKIIQENEKKNEKQKKNSVSYKILKIKIQSNQYFVT